MATPGDRIREPSGVELVYVDMPGNTAYVHPWTSAPTIEADIDGLALGVERYFETLMALAQQGETDEKFDTRSPLQSALTIRELLMPGTSYVQPRLEPPG